MQEFNDIDFILHIFSHGNKYLVLPPFYIYHERRKPAVCRHSEDLGLNDRYAAFRIECTEKAFVYWHHQVHSTNLI